MGSHDAPGDRQPDARPGVALARSPAGHPVEALEDPLEVGGIEALTGVGHLDEAGSVVAPARHPQLPARRRGTDGVAEQVGDDLGDAVRVGDHGDRLRRGVDDEPQARVLGLWPQPLGGRVGERSEVHVAQHQVQASLLRPRQGGEVVGEPPQPSHLVADAPQLAGGRRQDAVDHRLDVAVDDRQRGAHLVRHLAEQAHAALLRLGESTAEGVDVGREVRELGLAGDRHGHGIPALGHLSRRRPHHGRGGG